MLALPREVKSFCFSSENCVISTRMNRTSSEKIRANSSLFLLENTVFSRTLQVGHQSAVNFSINVFSPKPCINSCFAKSCQKNVSVSVSGCMKRKVKLPAVQITSSASARIFRIFCRYKRAHFPQTYRQQLRIKRKINVLTCKKSGKRENKYHAVPKRKNASIFSMAISQVPAFGMNRISRGLYAKRK